MRGRNGLCNAVLNRHHACTCAVGGGVIRRHNRLTRWLAAWLQDGLAPGHVQLEQRVTSVEGVMDVTIAQDPRYRVSLLLMP